MPTSVKAWPVAEIRKGEADTGRDKAVLALADHKSASFLRLVARLYVADERQKRQAIRIINRVWWRSKLGKETLKKIFSQWITNEEVLNLLNDKYPEGAIDSLWFHEMM